MHRLPETKRTISGRFVAPLIVAALLTVAGGFALRATAASADNGNRLQASFSEAAQQVTNRLADLGTLQIINTGTGTVQGYGAATVVVGINQDHAVTPCGAGSWTNDATRRITLSQGILVIHEISSGCPTPSGPKIIGQYQIDGAASTGTFAGASGTGDVSVDLTTHTSSLDGKLHLAGSSGA
jgi:hypothetical protein